MCGCSFASKKPGIELENDACDHGRPSMASFDVCTASGQARSHQNSRSDLILLRTTAFGRPGFGGRSQCTTRRFLCTHVGACANDSKASMEAWGDRIVLIMCALMPQMHSCFVLPGGWNGLFPDVANLAMDPHRGILLLTSTPDWWQGSSALLPDFVEPEYRRFMKC